MIIFEVNQQAGKKRLKAFWQKLSRDISRVLKSNKKVLISVAIVDDVVVKTLNRNYRGKNRVTDVLSFAEIDLKQKNFGSGQKEYLGEIVICHPQAVRQAKKDAKSLEDELRWLLVHGFLHLLGYDHTKKQAEKVMRRLEEKILG